MKLQYITIIDALARIKGESLYEKFRRILCVYDAYSAPFNVINARLLFDGFPDHMTWVDDKSFVIDALVFSPKTISDFLSIMNSIKIDLTPREGVFFLLYRNGEQV